MSDTILVIDDDRSFRVSIQYFLEENGYATVSAATGSEAFARLQANSYQAVLLDLILPDINGMELAEYLSVNHPDTAVVILTGYGTMNSAIQALRYGIIDYLHKPCRPELLQQIIARGIESKRLKQEIITSKRKFRQLAAATSEGIVFFSRDRLLQFNSQFCTLFGHTRETLEQRHLKELIEDWPGFSLQLEQCNSETPEIFESVGIFRNGTPLPLEIRLRRLGDRAEESWVGAFRDITARKREELNRLKMQEELTNAQRMESIGLMAGSVAHDLNNILTSVVTFPELLLLDMPSTAQYRDDISRIRKAGKQAAAVVNDLLTVTRGATCRKEPCDLNQLLDEYRQSLEFTQQARAHEGLEFEFQLQTQLPTIQASTLHINKSLINLVTNAVEATHPQGTITISTASRCLKKMHRGYETIPPGSYVVLSVVDSGTGIPAASLPHIFDPFFSKKSLGHSGTGLGLTIIWNTVRDHHGYIDLASTEAGSSFELYFPVSQNAQRQNHATDAQSIDALAGNGETVLIVDDENSQLEVTASLLRRLGYTPLTATNGRAALDIVRKEPIDLLLLDLWIDQDMDGYETYRQVQRLQPQQKAVITSGYFSEEDRETAKGLGINEQLTKPYSLKSLARAIHRGIHTAN